MKPEGSNLELVSHILVERTDSPYEKFTNSQRSGSQGCVSQHPNSLSSLGLPRIGDLDFENRGRELQNLNDAHEAMYQHGHGGYQRRHPMLSRGISSATRYINTVTGRHSHDGRHSPVRGQYA